MSLRALLGWTAVVVLAAGAFVSGCGHDATRLTGSNAANGVPQGMVSMRLVATHHGTGGSAGDNDNDRSLRDIGIAQLSLTFDTIRLYGPEDEDTVMAPPDSSGHGHDDRGEGDDQHGGESDFGRGHEGGPPDSSGDPDSLEHGGEHHGGLPKFIEILPHPVTVNTTQLGDTLGFLLTQANVPAGFYSHLSLRISDASAVTDSGATVAVTPPPDSLVRILSRFRVVEGQGVTVRVQIDLDRSVREEPPGSGHYFLRPILSGELRRHEDD